MSRVCVCVCCLHTSSGPCCELDSPGDHSAWSYLSRPPTNHLLKDVKRHSKRHPDGVEISALFYFPSATIQPDLSWQRLGGRGSRGHLKPIRSVWYRLQVPWTNTLVKSALMSRAIFLHPVSQVSNQNSSWILWKVRQLRVCTALDTGLDTQGNLLFGAELNEEHRDVPGRRMCVCGYLNGLKAKGQTGWVRVGRDPQEREK